MGTTFRPPGGGGHRQRARLGAPGNGEAAMGTGRPTRCPWPPPPLMLPLPLDVPPLIGPPDFPHQAAVFPRS